MRTKLGPHLAVVVTLFVALVTPPALAAYITVHGGPTYTPGIGGFQATGGGVTDVNDAGTVVGSAERYDSSGASLGLRAVRWDGSGAPAVELGNFYTTSSGYTQSNARAINNTGTAVGSARLYLTDTTHIGDRSVRWNGSGTAVTSLGQLSTASNVTFYSDALAINDAGTAVGWAHKVLGMGGSFGDYKGTRAVRWNASGTAATELGHLGTDSSGVTNATAYAINTAGTAVGSGQKFTSGADRGYRAVRWNPGGTAATELGNLGTDPNGATFSGANAVNDAGIAVGSAIKYDASGANNGNRAVRWNAGGTAATELGHLGTDLSGITAASASAINSAGTAIGSALKFDPSGTGFSERAVRWDASATAATELGSLPGFTYTSAEDINEAGTVVGAVKEYDAGKLLAAKAVYWGLDGLAVDLNTLIDPASGWRLSAASAISNTGWIGGNGTFDPDGPGGEEPYERLFLMQVPAVVPEPETMLLFSVGLIAMFGAFSDRSRARRRERSSVHRHAARRPRYERLEDRRLLSLTATVSYSVGSAPQSVVTADFNKDSRLDLAVANSSSNNVSVLLGKIDGTFQPAQTPATGARPVAIDVGDFNADGRLDLVTANYSDNTFSVLLGNGQGGFGNPINTAVNVHPQAVAVGDFNSDGKLDVVTGSSRVSVSGQSTLSMRLGNGDATFRSTGAYNGVFGESLSLATGDFNADGKLDLVASTTDTYISDYDNTEGHVGRVIVLAGNGLGDFGGSDYSYLRSWFPGDLAVADLNADGKLDVVTANKDSDTVSVLLGNGNGTLRYSYTSSDFATGGTPTSVALGDFNRDGEIDIVTANPESNDVSVLRGSSDGTFPAAENYSVGTGASAIAGDLNSDGNVDAADFVVLRKTGGTSTQYDVWRAHFGQFADLHLFAIIAGDSNGDGWLDVATANSNGNSISVLINDHSWGAPPSIVAPLTALAEPEHRDAIESQEASESDGALTVVDPQLSLFISRGPRLLRRLHALPTTESDMKERGYDLLLVPSAATKFDPRASGRGHNSRLTSGSTEEAVETRLEALDMAFATLGCVRRTIAGRIAKEGTDSRIPKLIDT